MSPTAVIDRHVALQPADLFSLGLKGHVVCALRQRGFDEMLGIAVGSWCVRPPVFCVSTSAEQTSRQGFERYPLPLSESTLMQRMP